MDDTVNKLFDYITDKYSEDDVNRIFDNEILEWVDYDQMEEEGIDTEYDYYNDYGRGEAEDAIIYNFINEAKRHFSVDLIDAETILLFEKIKEHYEVLNYI